MLSKKNIFELVLLLIAFVLVILPAADNLSYGGYRLKPIIIGLIFLYMLISRIIVMVKKKK